MNKLLSLVFFFLVVACAQPNQSDSPPALISKNQEEISNVKSTVEDPIYVDLKKSKILWKGTKMRGMGKHEGEINLKSGWISLQEGMLGGARFEIDMASITVTDIPKSDPIPIKNLTDHLKSEDFFDVAQYPVSRFELLEAKSLENQVVEITGNLTIKGITNQIRFVSRYDKTHFFARFTLDRFDWNIAYEGSWADRTLVDRDIEFEIKLVLHNSN